MDSLGPLALVIQPGGDMTAERLPAGAYGAHMIAEIVGGHLEGVMTAGSDWVAYVDEDGARHGAIANLRADALARYLGWTSRPGDWLKGPVVFLGREGVTEVDVPPRVLALVGLETGAP